MAFHLSHSGPLEDQLRAIVRDELRAARRQLDTTTPSQDAVHEARKSVKKARAVFRLLRETSRSRYDAERERLRVAAHALASLRNADAKVDTITALHGRFPTVVTTAVMREVKHGLQNRRRRIRAHAASALGRARRALERSERSAPGWIGRVGSFSAARSGIVNAYRRATKALEELSPDTDAARFHLWRKRVKDLWYHLRLFEGVRRAATTRVSTLARLETLLGEDHDLAALRGLMLASDRFGNARTSALVLGAITKRQASLRKRALVLGHRVFARSSGDFDAAVVKWWRSH